jgi:hypothetical protein
VNLDLSAAPLALQGRAKLPGARAPQPQTPGSRALWVAISAWLALSAGCGGPVRVETRFPRPARIAARAFPHVYVVATPDLDAETLADALVERLAAADGRPRPVRAERIGAESLNRRRAARSLAEVSIVISISVEYQEEYRPDYQARPLTVCGPGGCGFAPRGRLPELTTLRALARFVVEDGPTGRRLDAGSLEARDEGSDPLSMRSRALLVLRQGMAALVDDGERDAEVALVPIDEPRALRALALAEEGDWTGCATRYGERVAAPDFAGRSPRERAAWLFNGGQAHRAAAHRPGADTAALLHAAGEQLRAAMALDPQPLYAEALAALSAQRREFQRTAAQREAAAHNFGLVDRAAPPAVAPAVPEGYR